MTVIQGDCLDVLSTLDNASCDFIFADPPYPGVKRKYGTMTPEAWADMMDVVMTQAQRLLTPTGSAVFVLQANSEKVGNVRPWLWDYLSRWTHEWNMVQDAYWWNTAAPPTVHCRRSFGLMRPSLKMCAWFGPPDCYRDQSQVLWEESDRNRAMRAAVRAGKDWSGKRHDQHQRYRGTTGTAASEERGGVTPFNVLPLPNTASRKVGVGHEGQTPEALTHWWLRYACPPRGRVLDPFVGTGTTLRVARELGLTSVGIEQNAEWCQVAAAG